jgi:hypothetical protein
LSRLDLFGGDLTLTILVALPTDDEIVLLADTRVTNFREKTFRDGQQKLRRIGTHCVFATAGSPEYADLTGKTVLDLNDIVERALMQIHKTSRFPILIDPTDIAKDLCSRLNEAVKGVAAAFNDSTFFLVYEYTQQYGLLGRRFEIELRIGQPILVHEKQLFFDNRPFWERVTGEHQNALANGSAPYEKLKGNDLFNRMIKGESLSVDESLRLSYNF